MILTYKVMGHDNRNDVLVCTTVWMHPENMMPNIINQMPKTKHCVAPNE